MTVSKTIYQISATATGGRDGSAKTSDGQFTVKLAKPKEMGGTGEGNNPEQLFASGYAACFLGAMQFVAGQDGKKLPPDATVTSTIGFGPRTEGGFGLTAALQAHIPGWSKEDAQALVEKAHQVCPYSNATRNNIDVGLSVA
jgi:Ohr subfamily peroxiredoxin